MKTADASNDKAGVGGRPPKFAEARRPVTVTLPERVLDKLASVDLDRAKAIVKCVEAVTGSGAGALKSVELVEVVPGKSLIVVGPCRALARIDWLRLVEIAPARYLLVLPSGTPVETLELAVHDLLEDLDRDGDAGDRAILEELRQMIGGGRRRRSVTKAELVFIDTTVRN